MPAPTPNPFPHGGSFVEGVGWVDSNHPLYQAPTAPAPAPAAPTAPAAAPPPAAPTAQPPVPGWLPYGDGGWAPPDHPAVAPTAPAAPPAAAAPPPAPPPAPAAPAAPGAAPAAPATPQSLQQVFRDSIQQTLLGPTPEEYAANAATGPEANAFKTSAQRSAERQRRQAAHSNAIAGGTANSPQLAMASRGIEQQRGESESQFIGELTGQRLEARRNELMNLYQIVAAMGDSQEARDLQREIANMNAAIERSRVDVSRQQVTNQRDLGLADIDVRRLLGQGDLDLRRYGIDTARETDLDQLGLGYSQLGYNAKRDALDRVFA